jgi:nucleotide-binding universal stress UspA family protein
MANRGPRKFLCVIDDTPECRVAIRFAARRAEHTLGKVALLYVMEPPDFREWKAVEARMREEAYKEAERALYEAAAIVNQVSGGRPELIIREGDRRDELAALLKADPSLSILVLGAGTGKAGPGPLVHSILSAEFGHAFPIPITVVPGGLSDADIDALA